MKTYIGQRPGDDFVGDCRVYVQEGNQVLPLRHVAHHSPTGFEWGYGGSGPADTALSILADFFGESLEPRPFYKREVTYEHSRAWPLHQRFKWDFIAGADREGFTITAAQIQAWLVTQALAP